MNLILASLRIRQIGLGTPGPHPAAGDAIA